MNNLQYLMSAYFHQDWVEESSQYEDILESFLINESYDTIVKTLKELKVLISTDQNPNTLDDIIFNKMGCSFDPAYLGISTLEWLVKITVIIDEFVQNFKR